MDVGEVASDQPDEQVRVADVAQLVVLGFHAALAIVLLVGVLTEPQVGSTGWLGLVTTVLVAATVLVWRRTTHWRVVSIVGLLVIGCGALGAAAGGSLGWWSWAAWIALALAVWDRGPRLGRTGQRSRLSGPGAG